MPRGVFAPIALLITSILATFFIVAIPQVADATGGSFVPKTAFPIDGQNTGEYTVGWGAGTTPAPDNYSTTGVYYANNNPDICQAALADDDDTEDDIAAGGVSMLEYPNWPSISGFTNGKSDLVNVSLAAETVEVPTSGGGSQLNNIVYALYERCDDDPGSMNGVLVIQGGSTTYLFRFLFNPSQGSSVEMFTKTGGGSFSQATVPASAVDIYAAQTSGEVAVNLTTLGILDDEGTCESVEVGGLGGTATGFSENSQMKDLVSIDPFTISSCGELTVSKETSTPTDLAFPYTVDQLDGEDVRGGQDAINDTVTTSQPDYFDDVFAQNDYQINEGTMPAQGWSLDKITCTYYDIFQKKTVETTVTSGDADFQVPPTTLDPTGNGAVCVITNSYTGIIVEKIGDGNQPDAGFGFEFEGESDFNLKFDEDKSFAATPGDEITITEKTLPATDPSWKLYSIVCRDESGAVVAEGDTDTQSVDVTAVKGEAITCTFDNNQKGRITVEKVTEGGDGTFSFDFNDADWGDITTSGGATTDGDELSREINGDDTYNVTEDAEPGWFLTSFVCDDPDTTDLLATQGDVYVGHGDTVTCVATNKKAADVTVTKTVSGIYALLPWEFDFTLVPTDGGATPAEANPQTIAGTGNVKGSPDASWTGLEPGKMYSITESSDTPVGGAWTPTWDCSVEDYDDNPDNGFQFEATPGMSLTCDVTNDAIKPDLTLTKDVSGIDDNEPWSFDFALYLGSNTSGGVIGAKDGIDTISGTGPTLDAGPLTWENLVPGTEYTIAEADTGGMFDQSLTCSGADGITTNADGSVTFTAGFGPTAITCEALNAGEPGSLNVYKAVDGVDGNLEWEFGFSLYEGDEATGTAIETDSISGTGVATEGPIAWADVLVPGTSYTLAEHFADYDGMYELGLVCNVVDGNESTPIGSTNADGSVTFTAGYDQTVVCTATNTAIPTDLLVNKNVTGVADDYFWEFGFRLIQKGETEEDDVNLGTQVIEGTGDGAGDGSQGGNATAEWSDLVPGTTYTLEEWANTDYVLTEFYCTTADGRVDAENGVITFVAGFDDEIECFATNEAIPSSLQLTKYVDGIHDTLDWMDDNGFDFTLSSASGGDVVKNANGGPGDGNDTITWDDLVPGEEYTLSEGDHTGYLQKDFTCTVYDAQKEQVGEVLTAVNGEITFEAGFNQTIVCEVTNEAKPSDIEITKTVSGVDATQDWTFSFRLLYLGVGFSDKSITGQGENPGDDTAAWENLVPGATYYLQEIPQTGYELTEFYCTVDGQRVDADDNGLIEFEAGFDDSIECFATNEAIPASLQLTKYVEGIDDTLPWMDGAGFDFTLSSESDGDMVKNLNGGPGDGDDTVTWTDLTPGEEYTLSEGDHTGYVQKDFTCTVYDIDQQQVGDVLNAVNGEITFEASFGQYIECEATNEAIPSDILVNKNVEDVDETWEWGFGFRLWEGDTSLGTKVIEGTGPGAGDDSVEWYDLVPGTTYTLEEWPDTHYELTEFYCTVDGQRVDADDEGYITFVAGFDDEIECFATNRALPGEVTVTKTVEGIADGFGWGFSIGISPAPEGEPGTQPVSDTGDDTVTWSNLEVGQTYKVYEVPAPGYTGVLTCDGVTDLEFDDDPATVDFRVESGQFGDNAIECEMVNTAIPSDLQIVKQVENVHRSHEWSFDFSLYEAAFDDEDIVLGDMVGSTSLSGTGPTDSEAYVFEDLVPGQLYAITETAVDGQAQILTCEIGGEAVTDLDGALDATVVFEAGLEQYIECTAVNTANPAYAKVIKTVSGATFPDDFVWAFDFEMYDEDGTLVLSDTLTGTGPVLDETDKIELLPYTEYTIVELNVDPLNPTPNWICWDGDIEYIGELFNGEGIIIDDLDGDPDNNAFTFLATPDLDLHCGVINYLRPTLFSAGSVSVTKEVAGEMPADAEWAFGITMTPQSSPEDAETAVVSGTGPSTSDSTLLWNGLAVGETYVISEDDTFESDVVVEDGPGVLSEYFTTELTCEGTTDEDDDPMTVTFTAVVDQEAISCAVVNTYIPPFVLASTGFGSMGVLVAAAILMMLGAAVVITRRQRGDSA